MGDLVGDRGTATTAVDDLSEMLVVLESVPECIWQVTFAAEDTFIFTRDGEGGFYLEGVE